MSDRTEDDVAITVTIACTGWNGVSTVPRAPVWLRPPDAQGGPDSERDEDSRSLCPRSAGLERLRRPKALEPFASIWRPGPRGGRVVRDRSSPGLRKQQGGPMRFAPLAALATVRLTVRTAPLGAWAQPAETP